MPHQKTTLELQERGRVLYRRKEYFQALVCFTEAITSEPTPSASLLDNRAATYDKLNDITPALKDAKSAIRLYEKDPTGYLRAGHLLEKSGKIEVALGIYKYGINKKTKNVELLVRKHDKLLSATASPTSADPFAQMPLELVEQVLSYLNFAQIVNCTRVSKLWNTLIASQPRLWTYLDLSAARRPVKNTFITHCLNRSGRNITRANLKLLAGPDKALTALLHHCKNLESLNVLDGGMRSNDFVSELCQAPKLSELRLGPEAPMTLTSLSYLAQQLTTLRHLEVRKVINQQPAIWKAPHEQLQTLILEGGVQGSDLMDHLRLHELLKRTPNLSHLEIHGFQTKSEPPALQLREHCRRLSYLDFRGCRIVFQMIPSRALPTSITTLREDYQYPRVLPRYAPTPGTWYLPKLRELETTSLVYANMLMGGLEILDHIPRQQRESWLRDPRTLEHLQQDTDNLSKLAVLRVARIDDKKLLTLLLSSSRLSHLQQLTLARSNIVDDTIAELIAQNCTHLQVLDLCSTAITGYGLKKFVERCPSLIAIKLRGCQNIGSDALEWARGKGVKIDHAMVE
ncbi:hypothetical protein AAFC00_000702 [Neodothiora populina]|uniref:F-box domain-containing protein n=2 Tax=Neodothiora populina TaxID=2781224 RepID=A0ABR3PE04_9PEZI